MCVFLPAFSVTQATNSSDFFDKEVFSSWHSKQASSAHDLTKTFLSFWILFPRETRERPLLLFFIFIDIVFCMCERPILPQISQITQTKPQNHINFTTNPTCLSLRNNAACCIPLRDLRYLRENIHMRVLNQSANKKPQYLPQIPLIYADKPQNHKTAFTSNNLSFSAW